MSKISLSRRKVYLEYLKYTFYICYAKYFLSCWKQRNVNFDAQSFNMFFYLRAISCANGIRMHRVPKNFGFSRWITRSRDMGKPLYDLHKPVVS